MMHLNLPNFKFFFSFFFLFIIHCLTLLIVIGEIIKSVSNEKDYSILKIFICCGSTTDPSTLLISDTSAAISLYCLVNYGLLHEIAKAIWLIFYCSLKCLFASRTTDRFIHSIQINWHYLICSYISVL